MRNVSISPYRSPFQSPSPPPERAPELELPAPSSAEYLDALRNAGARTPPDELNGRVEHMKEVAKCRAPNPYIKAPDRDVRPNPNVIRYHPYI